MTYLNQFHKEAVERKLRKIAESLKSPMSTGTMHSCFNKLSSSS